MPSMDDVANNIVSKMIAARTWADAKEILFMDVNTLVYEDDKQPASLGDKERVLEKVRNIFQSVAQKSYENANYIALVQQVLEQLRNSKR